MATVTEQKFNHEDSQRRVRHPLALLRKYIRTYVILEGLALTILFVTGLFWLGLAFDFGLYKFDVDLINVHGIDWIQELNDVDSTGFTSKAVRIIFLIVFTVALVALGITKVVLRWLRDFNDRTIALVLERRFPKQLGDRLITAIELADPKLSKKYGYSQAMVEKTIMEAVEAIKKLPVSGVFNWGRLFALWFLVGVTTFGLLIVTMVLFCVGSLFTDSFLSPYGFGWRFYDVASIWTERNLLLTDSYWPRRSYLEIGRFQRSAEKPNDMRVARDELPRPELQVRAIEWVVADRAAPSNWRALKWKDLNRYLDPAVVDAVAIPREFAHWKVDPDELEPNLVAALFGTDTAARRSGAVREHLHAPGIQRRIDERGAQGEVDAWLDWREWTLDKLQFQLKDAETKAALEKTPDYSRLKAVFAELEEQVERPSMSRTLRKLIIPTEIAISFHGEETSFYPVSEPLPGNKFKVALDDLKDSTRFRFRARGEDFFTPPKFIVLVPAPSPSEISIDKEEPAYIMHRLPYRMEKVTDPSAPRGEREIVVDDQTPLAQEKHVTKNFAQSITGDTNSIDVPFGANLTIHVRIDRKLRGEKSVFPKDPPTLDAGFAAFPGRIKLDEDLGGFSLILQNVTRQHDFLVEFFDEDNIRGKRRFRVQSAADTDPKVGILSVAGVELRKPKLKAIPVDSKGKEKDPADQREYEEAKDALLITPNAIIPFECPISDNYGLVRVGYHYKVRKTDFDLGQTGAKNTPTQQLDQAIRLVQARAVVSCFQYWPGNGFSTYVAPQYMQLMSTVVNLDIAKAQGYQEKFIASEGFQKLRESKRGRMMHLEELRKHLVTPAGKQPPSPEKWEFDFKDDPGFNVFGLLPHLKATDPDKVGQSRYLLKIAVEASDNNVVTGSPHQDERGILIRGNTKKNDKGYVTFLVVSENELLTQIAMQEEELYEKLEIAKEKVDAGITTLQEQQVKLNDKNIDLDNVLNRMNEIRTALGTAGTNLRDSHKAYQNILREMRVNRVSDDRQSKIKNKIIDPLDEIVNLGSFDAADEAFQKALGPIEDEVANKRNADVVLHKLNITDANRKFNKLSRDITLVLDAMSQGIADSKLIALLISIQDSQTEINRELTRLHRKAIEEELRRILEGDPKEKKK